MGEYGYSNEKHLYNISIKKTENNILPHTQYIAFVLYFLKKGVAYENWRNRGRRN